MIRLTSALMLAGALLTGAASFADDSAKPDDQIAADYLAQYVYELTTPMFVFHWFSAEGRNSIWKTAQSYKSEAGYDHLASMSVHYWASLCSKNAALNPSDCPSVGTEQFGQGNMYGPGLYAALDPVATMDYGGGSNGQTWILLKIRLPVGFRFINLKRDGTNAMPLRVQKVLSAYQCPTHWIDVRSGLDGLMRANNTYMYNSAGYSSESDVHLTDTCLLELRHLLKDHLKINGLLYGYSATSFLECGGYSTNQADLSGTAWVIADSSPFTYDDVQVFSSNTPDGDEERIRIQSMFYTAQRAQDASYGQTPQGFQDRKYPQFPNYTVSRVSSGCDLDAISQKRKCGVVLTLQNSGSGEDVTVVEPYPSMTGKMSDQRLPQWFANYNRGQALWPDLLNNDIDPKLTDWMKANLVSCQDAAPVRAARKMD